MSDSRNIVILGASNAGLAAAHYTIRHILPKLRLAKDSKYTIFLVDPSTHYWWHVSAPRAIVSTQQIKHSEYFKPIADSFKQYNLGAELVLVQGSASKLLTEDRQVVVTKADGAEESIPYYALVIATGITSPTPLTTLHGDHQKTIDALEAMNKKLASAKEVIIGGGGPVGVETAGEIAVGTKAKVTLITGSTKLIPIYSASRAKKAQNLLEKHGVTVVYSAKVTSATEADGKVTVQLSNGSSMTADVYIPASGVTPNTSFLPAPLLGDRGYVKTNPNTLRVDGAGPRAYALGDVAGVNQGGMLHFFDTVPVMGANLAHDLLKDAGLTTVAERSYTAKETETQLIPIGPRDAVGAFNGWGMPGFIVSMFKGKDYMKGQIAPVTTGSKFAKA